MQDALKAPVLNELMSLGRPAWRSVRTTTQALLLEGSALAKNAELRERCVSQIWIHVANVI